MMRRNARATGEAYCTGIVRRMVSLPRNLVGGFSRVVNHGMDLMGLGYRRNQHLPSNFPPPYPPQPVIIQDEWAFLAAFEQHYGMLHPFFYACRFAEALRIARAEHKFVFMYLHSAEHPFTASFCRDSLCSEPLVQFLDANFVSWGGLVNRGEGLQMTTVLQPGSFPFCAVVAPASGDNLAVLQQIEGPVSPADLVEILQRTMEEQGSAFGSSQANGEEKRRADEILRKEQDAAYLAALQIDQEKERVKNLPTEERRVQIQTEASNRVNEEKDNQNLKKKQSFEMHEATTSRETQADQNAATSRDGDQICQILIRFPNGERREQSFQSNDKVEAIYGYIDSLRLPGVGNYRLISSFPRKVYDVDQMEMTLNDAGFCPRASLFLELV